MVCLEQPEGCVSKPRVLSFLSLCNAMIEKQCSPQMELLKVQLKNYQISICIITQNVVNKGH